MPKVIFPIILISFWGLISCTTTRISAQKQNPTSEMENLQDLTNQLLSQLDRSEASLNNLTDEDNKDIQGALNSYTERVRETVNLKEEYEELSERMVTSNNQYLEQWEKEGSAYENPELREVSEKRREELDDKMDAVNENAREVRRALKDYVTTIEEIESYVSKDLTAKGISAVTPLTSDVEDNSARIREAVEELQNSIAEAQQELGRER